ncbi:MAG: nucleotidyltransferase domain-containing protein [Coriobacteriia bacterium]|nr:nucleotidyltransferase domain-containing protein [Coriobacteriia bacterium]
MYKRLNITLSEDVLTRADEYAHRERYSRSALISAALDAFTGGGDAGEDLMLSRESGVAYAVPAKRAEAVPRLDETARLLRAFFAARDDVEAAWVFGSVARDEAGPLSDVDVAVLPVGATDEDTRWSLELDLRGRLTLALGVERVDVVVIPAPGTLLGHRAVVEGVRVFGADSWRAAEAEIAAAREYWDTEALRRAKERGLFEGQEIDE